MPGGQNHLEASSLPRRKPGLGWCEGRTRLRPAREHLRVASPCSLGSSQHGGFRMAGFLTW